MMSALSVGRYSDAIVPTIVSNRIEVVSIGPEGPRFVTASAP